MLVQRGLLAVLLNTVEACFVWAIAVYDSMSWFSLMLIRVI